MNITGKSGGGFRQVAEILSNLFFCRVTSTYLWPFKEDVTRFDFEVDKDDEQDLLGWL